MLNRRPTKIFKHLKQIIDISRRTRNLIQHNVPQLFYNNYEAITFFIKYLRKRQALSEPVSQKTEEKRSIVEYLMILGTSDFSFSLKEWWAKKLDEMRRSVEKDTYERYIRLGPDLAAAMFVIKIGGKVKFKGENEWIDRTKKERISKFPKKFDPNYILDELDLNKYPLRYEHLHFIFNLYYLRSLSLKGCRTIDDWALDKLSAEFPMLEYLNISECKNVTEKGLGALYRMPNLKAIIVTNFQGTAAFDLTCFLLEDVNPYLQCIVQQPKYKSLPK
ncbi:unnamed protein product [Xylocopa violacea]|uniref:Mitochondrial ATP synthase regulatory component factor B n=1 Tax=Xylocopa violacea TaxID=135666 RepID=A0ABP1PDV6_XYLVO